MAVFFSVCTIAFLAIGVVVRGPVGLFWSFVGLMTGVIGFCCFRDLHKNLFLERNPAKGYIDHLRDLSESRAALETKIGELENLVGRQETQHSERADNRKRLLTAALKNRRLKLQLIDETEFIIESRRKISHLEALAQDIREGKNLRESEMQIDRAFTDINEWMKEAPQCRSASGQKVRQSLEQAIALHGSIREQIEDRLVMRALDERAESEEGVVFEKVHEFLERHALLDDFHALEMEESVAADEEFTRINAELRLLRDGLKHHFENETLVDLEPEEGTDTSMN